jgi:hypothetical protein
MIGPPGDTEKKKEVAVKPEEKAVVVKAEEAKSKEIAPLPQKAAEKKVPVINGAANKKANNNNSNNSTSNTVNGVPKTKPTPANNNNNKLKPVKVIPPKAAPVAAASTKSKSEIPKIVEPDKEAQKEVSPTGANLTNILRAAFIRKSFFSTYTLALQFFGKRMSAQKLLVKCW